MAQVWHRALVCKLDLEVLEISLLLLTVISYVGGGKSSGLNEPWTAMSCAVISSSNHSRGGRTFPENLCTEGLKKVWIKEGRRTLTWGPACKRHNTVINNAKSSDSVTVQQDWTVRHVLSNDRLWSGCYRPGPAGPGCSLLEEPGSEWTEVWEAELKTTTGTTLISENCLTSNGVI